MQPQQSHSGRTSPRNNTAGTGRGTNTAAIGTRCTRPGVRTCSATAPAAPPGGTTPAARRLSAVRAPSAAR
eukprot:14952621-Alexandrium_andersonii.AAC.1